ncbi:CLUMA_CG001246, isoform A [Clunio marinus]|uniref:CLUMA_CG001246, isoform A n=1 Tax=Clunio marinus TaxID=568069 RepID=A0A1J1HHG3_9DIPT|nr:CLUMA_CG001246, isoform A [Clunio marinus]
MKRRSNCVCVDIVNMEFNFIQMGNEAAYDSVEALILCYKGNISFWKFGTFSVKAYGKHFNG